MSTDLNKVLAELAAKLGVTSEHLYGALLRQAYVAGVWDLTMSLLILAAIWTGVWLWFRNKGKLSAPLYMDFSSTGAVLFVAVMTSMFASEGLYYGISYLLTPDYYVLRHLGIVDR